MLANRVRMVATKIPAIRPGDTLVYSDTRDMSIVGNSIKEIKKLNIYETGTLTLVYDIKSQDKFDRKMSNVLVNGEVIHENDLTGTNYDRVETNIDVKNGDELALAIGGAWSGAQTKSNLFEIRVKKKLQKGIFIGVGEEFHK